MFEELFPWVVLSAFLTVLGGWMGGNKLIWSRSSLIFAAPGWFWALLIISAGSLRPVEVSSVRMAQQRIAEFFISPRFSLQILTA